ncbi:hypothetical protein AB205_0109590 [Aquarana catesbeiana]|uniref:Uncharacterized protein n=1 Tax=Aquarana catesbeiana TaxID=8400 RepID=A0A2G9RE82_AQUCT|nr:hypothetical protein AB205_0109590 [Aquarana catesbeiana]
MPLRVAINRMSTCCLRRWMNMWPAFIFPLLMPTLLSYQMSRPSTWV